MPIKDLASLVDFRKKLHQHPEVSGKEKEAAKMVKDFLADCHPDEVLDKLGGKGIAFRFQGGQEGPTTIIRCELDALPILEKSNLDYASQKKGVSHACGHDGHMAIVAGVGKWLAQNRPKKGNVVLLFQPAEETGEGARKVISSRKFKQIKPDFAFALHNLPGYPMHQVLVRKGAFAAASKGMVVQLKGKTSHAAHPEAGLSPMEAMSKIMVALEKLPCSLSEFCLITVVHAKLGEVSFGTAPGEATIMATLRAYEDEVMDQLTDYAEKLTQHIAKEYGLEVNISYTEIFAATDNHFEATELVERTALKLDLKIKKMSEPFRWSEDFGHFSSVAKTCLFGLGAGLQQPQLHEPTFDFPDELLETGVKMFVQLLQEIHD